MISVPDRPSLLGITVEGDEWWEGQRDVIRQVAEAFTDKRFVFLNAPTGSGKTIIATAVQRLLDLDAVNLTHSIQLEEQYARTLPDAIVVKGRRNFRCELPSVLEELDVVPGMPELMADDAPCAYGDGCPEDLDTADGCGYYQMLFRAAKSRQVILNYAYAVRMFQSYKIRLGGLAVHNPFYRGLLVCDEGDLAEGAVVQAASISISPKDWPRLPDSGETETWVEWARSRVESGRVRVEEKRKGAYDDPTITSKRELARLVRALGQLEGLASLKGNWLVDRSKKTTLFRPLWGSEVARRVLWGQFPRVLFMSATLGDPGILATKMGIPYEEVEYLDVPSHWPAENRPVYYRPVARMSRRSSSEDWERVAKFVYDLGKAGFAERKGIIHCGSYENAHRLWGYITQWSHDRRYFTHRSALDTGAIQKFADAKEPLVLISPSSATGVDIPYQIGWQVVVKVPFGNLGDPIVRARREYVDENGEPFGQRNYDSEAMGAVVQAAGRAVRAPDDTGVTVITDSNFLPLYKRTYAPQFFREAFRR